MPIPPHITRINVVGTSGSGKSTFSKRLAKLLHCKAIELDELHWRANWIEAPDEEMIALLEKELAADAWVLDGNYTRTIPIKWRRVQMVIWLDYSFATTLYRMVKRSLSRIVTGEKLWHGNTENMRMLFSKDSIVWWMITTYYPNKRKYEEIMQDSKYSHIQFVRLKTPGEAEGFLRNCLTGQRSA